MDAILKLSILLFGKGWKGWFDSKRLRCIGGGLAVVLLHKGLGLELEAAIVLFAGLTGWAVCDTFRPALPKK